MVKLGDVCEKVAKWDPKSRPKEQFLYVDLGAVSSEHKAITNAALIEGKDAPSRARQLITADDILVATVRPNLNAVARVQQAYDAATASTGFCVLRPSRTIDSQYLFHWVRTPMFVSSMIRKSTGASYPAVSDRVVRESEIPLPPMDEQRRIAEILDRVDGIRTKRRQQLAHLDDLTQAIFHDMFDKADHHVDLFGDLITDVSNGTSPKCEARPAHEGEWGILKLSAVTQGFFKPYENKAYQGDVSTLLKNEVREGDVLMTRKNTRELVGAVTIASNVPERLLLPDLIFRLTIDESRINPQYFQSLMMSNRKRETVRDLSNGSAGSMPNISKARLRTLPIEVPPLELQHRFAQRIEAVRSKRTSIERALAAYDELLAALQGHAFGGV